MMDDEKRAILRERMPEAFRLSQADQERAVDALDELDLVADVDTYIMPLVWRIEEELDEDIGEERRLQIRMALRTLYLMGWARGLTEHAELIEEGNSLFWEPLPDLEDAS